PWLSGVFPLMGKISIMMPTNIIPPLVPRVPVSTPTGMLRRNTTISVRFPLRSNQSSSVQKPSPCRYAISQG
ncbi:MAG: hypothetical protein M1393_04345, partial [Candidatus Thermoplasmatota archaeon]|nr:hypothetical protein [Candidatus Thermoplasmatota archaeon]